MTTEASLERDLASATRRHREAKEVADAAERERDRVIRDALEAKLAKARVSEITGLKARELEEIRKAG